MRLEDFKKKLFSNPKTKPDFLKKPGNNGHVDLWKNAVSQSPLILVEVFSEDKKLVFSADTKIVDSHGVVSVEGGRAPNPVSSAAFASWFNSSEASKFEEIVFQMDEKRYSEVKKIQYDQQSGNIDIYLEKEVSK